jgi:type IV secretory pathway VirB2 component (pilin)
MENKMSKSKTNFLMLTLAVAAMLVPEASFAGGLATLGTRMCSLYHCILSGSLLTVIATVGIFFLGIGAFFGKVNWGLVIIIALGIVVITGAMGIAEMFVEGGTGCAVSTCDETAIQGG